MAPSVDDVSANNSSKPSTPVPVSYYAYSSSHEVPCYRPPIAYTSRTWSLDNSSWGDIDCREFLRFTRSEIAQLPIQFDLIGSEL